jgi:predicted MFS family arabinose efflux permease
MINPMNIVTNKFWVRFFFFTALVVGSYNFLGQSLSFSLYRDILALPAQDALWLLRGFQSGTVITGIAGLVFIKWLGNRYLFIGSTLLLLIATIFSFKATTFNVLLVSRIAAGYLQRIYDCCSHPIVSCYL